MASRELSPTAEEGLVLFSLWPRDESLDLNSLLNHEYSQFIVFHLLFSFPLCQDLLQVVLQS